ncbi:ATP/GTP-binding protein [Streptomyces sp. RB110-1]|uniref:ATP/GTP-binding protein n=1 Tax=unclassified Streptomyces TaxID=2593676 RepID=UPI001901F21D|nr:MULTISPECIES: ATP/GTP-binding protein [unclassified Streptomyces]MBK0374049.1 ATP/GTP-binding protein [Streptomyces sp. RB110-1]MBK0389581.1 ATP/GTP-binding protein [Streptomyces sp. RB110-2]
MDDDGTRGVRGPSADRLPGPAVPPPPTAPPRVPPPAAAHEAPRYRHAPATPPAGSPQAEQPAPGAPVDAWLRTPRPPQEPGVWRYGYTPPPPEASETVSDRSLLVGALISLLSALLLWSLWRNGYLPYRLVPLKLFTPGEWWNPGTSGGPRTIEGSDALTVYEALLFGLLVYGCGRIGNFAELFRRHVAERGQPFLALAAAAAAGLAQLLVWKETLPVVRPILVLVATVAGGEIYQSQTVVNVIYALIAALVLWPFARLGRWRELLAARRGGGAPTPAAEAVPATATSADQWPDLRAAGWTDAADTLSAEVRTGRMNDVDVARLRHAWKLAAQRPDRLAPLAESVLRNGGAAALHPSGRRDLPLRTARHDVLTGQVRIGRCADDPHNPYVRRGTGLALEPALLGTSLLAVGPPGAGKSDRLIRPVVEALALRALAGQAAVLAVGGAGAPLGPDDAFDVVVRVGNPGSAHDIDLYGGTTDPDEAAAVLAEGLVGDIGSLDSRRAATVLAQLLGPYRAAHGHFPSVPALRELLDGAPDALTALRAALEAGGHQAMLRELDARARQAGGPGDPAPVLADRVALLDRPAFAGFFATGPDARPFELRALGQYPLRVRVDLPERGHAEASRLLTRLLLAQFTAITAARTDTTLFACLVLDDATHAVTAETVRGIRRLRSVNAGAVLALRTVDDVPEALHTPLLGAVGCTAAFSGITTWDGKRFAEAWGKEWVETREVAQHTVFADQPFTRALHALRKLVTGKAVTTDAVTVRQVEKERWSASELAYAVPAGHAVVRVATVQGEHAPPLLVHLDG